MLEDRSLVNSGTKPLQEGLQGEGSLPDHHLSDLARLRGGTYRLLAAWFFYPNDFLVAIAPEAARLLRQYEEVASNLAFYNQWQSLLDALDRMRPPQLQELQVSYMRLFSESGSHPSIPLCESGYLSSPEQIPWVGASIVRQYQEGGVALSAQEVPDHLAVELEFLAYLCNREMVAWKEEKWRSVSKILAGEKRFLNDHLYKWLPALLEKILERKEGKFYHLLSKTAWAVIAHDSDFVSALQETVEGS